MEEMLSPQLYLTAIADSTGTIVIYLYSHLALSKPLVFGTVLQILELKVGVGTM